MPKNKNQRGIPFTNMVIFGGNGDLTWRKLIPALFNLYINHHLPANFSIFCIHYEALDEKAFKKRLHEGVTNFSRSGIPKKAEWQRFARHIIYFQGDFTNSETYEKLKFELEKHDSSWKERGSRLFYYSVAPKFIETISVMIADHKLAEKVMSDRIIIEKPFGNDLESANSLNELLSRHFNEKQIYRIDHYLGKETVQNIMAFRFANIVFEPIWNHQHIEQVQITVAEEGSIGNRGNYYDQTGALKDMIQNHLLQLLCIVAMEPPVSFTAEDIRNKKADVLKAIRLFTNTDLMENVVRGQYGAGKGNKAKQQAYRQEKNVSPGSTTETFVAMKLFIDSWRWQNVPFYLRTGKCLERSTSIIAIQFKPVLRSLFPPGSEDLLPNRLIISIQPEQEITLLFHAKEPGLHMRMMDVEMDFTYKESYSKEVPEAYETLLLDALKGDPTLFMREDQVEAAWKVITPVINYFINNKPQRFPNYEPGGWGPRLAEDLIKKDGFEWILLPTEPTMKHLCRKKQNGTKN